MKLPEMILDQLSQLEGAGNYNILPIVNVEGSSNVEDIDIPNTLPILATRDAVLFPGTVLPVTIGRQKSLKLIKTLYKGTKIIATFTQKNVKVEEPDFEDLYNIGVAAKIIKIIELPDGTLSALLQGIHRISLKEILSREPYLVGIVENLPEVRAKEDDNYNDYVADSIKDAALTIIKMSPNIPQELSFAIKNIEGFEFLINFIAANMEFEKISDKIKILSESNPTERGMRLLELLQKQIEFIKLKNDIQQKVKSEMDQQQREYYLNNQLKTIQEELGMGAGSQDSEKLRERAAKKRWPAKVAAAFSKELSKLEKMVSSSPDYSVQLNYLEFMLDLPWDETTLDNLSLSNAQEVLDKDHYGLDKVKERIIEYLAVLKLKGDMKSPILCLYGPPGVGKTSLGKSIAKALGRKYGRISLGGMHDESEIRGHRKTYIGAMPGRIIDTIKKCGSSNPVIVLDEIDKVASDYKGDPSSALLEALDPEQNTAFHDNYLDVDYDLSKVLFITTANNIGNISPALKDRMEMIPVSGYLAEEKYFIAKDHLIKKQREAHGLKSFQFKINKAAIETVINEYTRESGVRNLDRQIAKLARYAAKRIAVDGMSSVSITPKDVKSILGLPVHFQDLQKGNEMPGVVTGLAWTEVGGEILFVECSLSKGKGVLTTTGNLGDVMKESATIAYQYIKAHPELIGVTAEEIASKDIHIHVPEGAVPKDGPSAGITIVSAMASAFSGKCVKHGIAMTGEMTLRGKVLPVGGIKEKILAAKRAGIDTIVLSEDNRRDINEIKSIYIEGLSFKYVKSMEDVLKFIFED